MAEHPYNVLFLCTGNSARSILAEALLNHLGGGRFRAFSAGSHPTGRVNPLTLEVLEQMGLPTQGLRSKSWNELGGTDNVSFDFIFTVCDSVAGEACPYWAGHPATAHWGVPDPAAVEGSELEKRQAFLAACRTLEHRIKLFIALPIASLDRTRLTEQLEAIGKVSAEGA